MHGKLCNAYFLHFYHCALHKKEWLNVNKVLQTTNSLFSIDLGTFFKDNPTELHQIDDNDIPGEILCQIGDSSLDINTEKNANKVNAADNQVEQMTL